MDTEVQCCLNNNRQSSSSQLNDTTILLSKMLPECINADAYINHEKNYALLHLGIHVVELF